MIRPELKTKILRWREAVAGAALSALGCWHALFGTGAVPFIGLVVAMGGAILLFTGLQRARFRAGQGGPGVVEILERQITYFDSRDGLSFSLDDVTGIEIETTGNPGAEEMTWVFDIRGEGTHRIPGGALGAERLFDALAGFIGADMNAVVKASGSRDARQFPIWKDRQGNVTRLH